MEPCYQRGAGVSWHEPSKKLACQYFCPYSICHIQDVSEHRASAVSSAERGKKPCALRLLVCLSRFQASRNAFLHFLPAISDYLPAPSSAKPQQSVKKPVSMAGRLLQAQSHIWLITRTDTNFHGERGSVHRGALLFKHTQIPWTQIPPHAIHAQPMQPLVYFSPCQSDSSSTRFSQSPRG